MAATDVAHALAERLRDLGLQRMYGLPGEDHLRLLDACAAVGLSYVAARDEASAAIMAATEAQASSLPGVVVVALAPGLTNAINGIAHAFLDHVPLIVISGQHHPERAPLIVRQFLDNHQLLGGITKWSTTASPRIHQILAKAIDTALAPPAGPVYLELRDEVAASPPKDSAADWPILQLERSMPSSSHLSASTPDPVARLVRDATRPVVIAGGGPGDPAALHGFAQHLRAPLFTTPSALGSASQRDAWFAGTFLNGNLEAEVVGRADLVISVDLDAHDIFNSPWRYAAPVVGINTHPDTQRFVPLQHQLVGPPADLLRTLIGPEGGASAWTPADVTSYRIHVESVFHLADGPLTIPAALCDARALLPPETLVCVDAGYGKPLTSYLWSAPSPNQYFTAHGLSTMGYALPAATALSLLHPERPVVGFMGDGSLLMRCSELSVASAAGVAPIFVAWLDRSLSQIELKQVRQRLEPVGARLPDVACAGLATAFGACGIDVHSRDEFRQALHAALQQRSTPTLIGARVDQTRRAEWFELIRG